jgi:hypothetical protein
VQADETAAGKTAVAAVVVKGGEIQNKKEKSILLLW